MMEHNLTHEAGLVLVKIPVARVGWPTPQLTCGVLPSWQAQTRKTGAGLARRHR
jgi:hypothetical protein